MAVFCFQGWLKGRNVTKGVSGLFPGDGFVQFQAKRRDSVKGVLRVLVRLKRERKKELQCVGLCQQERVFIVKVTL